MVTHLNAARAVFRRLMSGLLSLLTAASSSGRLGSAWTGANRIHTIRNCNARGKSENTSTSSTFSIFGEENQHFNDEIRAIKWINIIDDKYVVSRNDEVTRCSFGE